MTVDQAVRDISEDPTRDATGFASFREIYVAVLSERTYGRLVVPTLMGEAPTRIASEQATRWVVSSVAAAVVRACGASK